MISAIRKFCAIVTMVVVVFLLSACVTPKALRTPHVKYTVVDQSVTVASAVTHYDLDAKAREIFLYWFKRGFETVFAGKSPMMITWGETIEGEAGREGYDFGMNEGERYMQNPKKLNQSLQTSPIPPR